MISSVSQINFKPWKSCPLEGLHLHSVTYQAIFTDPSSGQGLSWEVKAEGKRKSAMVLDVKEEERLSNDLRVVDKYR